MEIFVADFVRFLEQNILFNVLESILWGLWWVLMSIQWLVILMFLYFILPHLISWCYALRLGKAENETNTKKSIDSPRFFLILVPAHNEARVLTKLLDSIRTQTYPSSYIKTVVIADNCNDDTVALAIKGGVSCLERTSLAPSSKMQALQYAWEHLTSLGHFLSDIDIVLLDADCQMCPTFLEEVYHVRKKEGTSVLQSFRYVLNKNESQVSMLDSSTEALRQRVTLGSRHVLGWQNFICGCGVVFPVNVFSMLMNVHTESIVEDRVWQGILLKRGIKVTWCPSAKIGYEVVQSHQDFQKQRKRWVMGQIRQGISQGFPMLLDGLVHFNASKIDYALSLLQFPRSALLLLLLLFTVMGYSLPFFFILPWVIWLIAATSLASTIVWGLSMVGASQADYGKLFLSCIRLTWGVARSTLLGFLPQLKLSWEATKRARS